jgi:CRISPR-associated protein Cpf1
VNKSELAKQVKFKVLYKQILGEKDEQEAFIEIKNDEEVFPAIGDFINEAEEKNKKIKTLLFDFYKDQMNSERRYDISRIYFSKPSLNTISNRWFSRWDLVRNALLDSMGKKKSNKEILDFVSLSALKDALKYAAAEAGLKNIFRDSYKKQLDANKSAFDNFLKIYQLEFDLIFCGQDEDAGYDKNLAKLREMMSKEAKYSNKKEKGENGEEIFVQNQIIKNYADSALAVYRMAKYFAVEKGGKPVEGYDDLDENFYDEAYYGYAQDNNVFKFYNALRDYLTKKGYKRDKVKVNFDKGTLMGGWSAGEKGDLQYCTAILRDNGKYFLAILKTGSAFNDKQEGISDFSNGEIELMEYEQLKTRLSLEPAMPANMVLNG